MRRYNKGDKVIVTDLLAMHPAGVLYDMEIWAINQTVLTVVETTNQVGSSPYVMLQDGLGKRWNMFNRCLSPVASLNQDEQLLENLLRGEAE